MRNTIPQPEVIPWPLFPCTDMTFSKIRDGGLKEKKAPSLNLDFQDESYLSIVAIIHCTSALLLQRRKPSQYIFFIVVHRPRAGVICICIAHISLRRSSKNYISLSDK